MNRTVGIIVGIIVLVLVAGGSFFGGTLYGKNQAQTALAARLPGGFPGIEENGQLPGQGRLGANARAGALGGMLAGQIKEIGDGTLTVTDNNGKETKVAVTDTTLIEKQASVELTDLTPGETVMISGSTGTDGTITARSVQVGSMGRFGLGGPGAAGTPAP